MPSSHGRLFCLDWVRIFVFIWLVPYHIGMYYNTEGWHVKSAVTTDAIEPLMWLSSPWRLGLLFMISGVASSAMLSRTRIRQFIARRSLRLLLPLVVGMLLIVPPQAYLEVVEKLGYQGSYLDFMRLYVRAYHGFCRESCLTLPTWNHLWFLPYLWCYTLVLAVLSAGAQARWLHTPIAYFKRMTRPLDRSRTLLLIAPVLVLTVLRIALLDRFPSTHALVDDWYSHACYLSLFLFGAWAYRRPGIWDGMREQRFVALLGSLLAWVAVSAYFRSFAVFDWEPAESLRLTMRLVYALMQWLPIVALCGFAKAHFDVDHWLRAPLTRAVFPLYVFHQTIIVVAAHAFKPLKFAPVVEAILLLVLTFTLSAALVAALRRMGPLGLAFGLDHAGAMRKPAATR